MRGGARGVSPAKRGPERAFGAARLRRAPPISPGRPPAHPLAVSSWTCTRRFATNPFHIHEAGPSRIATRPAIDPTSRGFGFVVLEGTDRLVDWGSAMSGVSSTNSDLTCLRPGVGVKSRLGTL